MWLWCEVSVWHPLMHKFYSDIDSLNIYCMGFLEGCYISGIIASRSVRSSCLTVIYSLVRDMCVEHCKYFLVSNWWYTGVRWKISGGEALLLEYMLIVRCWFSKLWMAIVQIWLEICWLLNLKATMIQDYGCEENWNASREDNRTLLRFNSRGWRSV